MDPKISSVRNMELNNCEQILIGCQIVLTTKSNWAFKKREENLLIPFFFFLTAEYPVF